MEMFTFMLASGPSVDCPSLQAGLIFILLADGGDGGEGRGRGLGGHHCPDLRLVTPHTTDWTWPHIHHFSVNISDVSPRYNFPVNLPTGNAPASPPPQQHYVKGDQNKTGEV